MSLFRKIVEIGLASDASTKEKKRIRLLNSLSIIFILVNLVLGILVVALKYEFEVAIVHFTIVPLQFFVLLFQYYKKYILARAWMWFLTYGAIFYFAFFGDTEVNNEYYFSILALLPLIFFDRRWIHWVALVLSCFGFMSMDFYYLAMGEPVKHMNNSSFVLFTMLFLIVNFFKNLNERQENFMAKQRDKALQQKKIIENQKKELEELNRFQSKFFVNISHELRTPLTLIGGAAEQLKGETSEQGKGHLDSISRQSDKIKTIVDDILDITKSKFNKLELSLQEIDLGRLLLKTYSSFKPTFELKDRTLSFSIFDDKKIVVKADLIYLERSINNLLLNSLKYTEAGIGRVDLEVKEGPDKTVKISIKDNGIGIKEADLPKIFDRFYQGENHINKSGGTGVGLSFVKDIIELHNGSVDIESAEGNGTLVEIILPAEYQEETNVVENDRKEVIAESDIRELNNVVGEQTVLIVEDHEEMRSYIASLLSNYTVLFAQNGQEGLECLEQNKVDYVITDYMMPVMDGYEFVKAVKAKKWDVPLLVLTARTDLKGKLDILRLGVDDYITKPFNQEELVIRVKNGLRNYKERRNYIETEKIEAPEIEDPFINKVRGYIEKNIADTSFGLDDICIEFAVSTSSLYRKVKSLTGLSSNEFVREVKLNYARVLVENKEAQSLKELAFAVGFNKASYFAGLYEKRFGRKPF